MRRPRWRELVPLGLWAGAFAVCLRLFDEMYWRHRDCFNELGRCFVPEGMVVYHEQSGPVYGALVVAALVGLLVQGVRVVLRLAKAR